MEECNVCAEAIWLFLLGEDLERNSSQEPQSLKPTSTPKPANSYPMPPSHGVEETVQISPGAASITRTSSGTQQTPTETHSTTCSEEKAPGPGQGPGQGLLDHPLYEDFVKP